MLEKEKPEENIYYKIKIPEISINGHKLKEENRIISKDDSKSKSLEKINKYKNDNIEINKITNNIFVTSKSYRKIDEEENKNEKKEEKRKTWRFGFQNKEGDIPEKKIEEIKDNKLLEPKQYNIINKEKENLQEIIKIEKENDIPNKKIEYIYKPKKDNFKISIPGKEENNNINNYENKESPYKFNISLTESRSKYQKERNIPKDININQYKQKEGFITSKSYKNIEELDNKEKKKEEAVNSWRFNIKNKDDIEKDKKSEEKQIIEIKKLDNINYIDK